MIGYYSQKVKYFKLLVFWEGFSQARVKSRLDPFLNGSRPVPHQGGRCFLLLGNLLFYVFVINIICDNPINK